MKILIKFTDQNRNIVWIDDPKSGLTPFSPKRGTDIAKSDTARLEQPLGLAENGEYKAYGRLAIEHAQHIARELHNVTSQFPDYCPPTEIEVSQSFAQALELPPPRLTIADWLERFS